MSYATDLVAAKNSIAASAAILDALVNGPASGTGSLVTLPNGAIVHSVARVAYELAGGGGGSLSLGGGTVTGPAYFIGGLVAYGGGSITSNVALGPSALGSNTAGAFSTAVGNNALASNTTGTANTAVGHAALSSNTTGTSCVAVGTNALAANTVGGSNTAVGRDALAVNWGGYENASLGAYSLAANTTGFANTAVGYQALQSVTGGAGNTGVGHGTLSSVTTGNNNVGMGSSAGSNLTTGSNNIILGYNAQPSSAGASNEITLGNSSIATIRAQVTSITSLSDRRFKKNIRATKFGIELIRDVAILDYEWNHRDKALAGRRQTGVIAQDLQKLTRKHKAQHLRLVHGANPDRLEATPGNLLFPTIRSVQQIDMRVASLEARIAKLERRAA
jgi:hypothetical protein